MDLTVKVSIKTAYGRDRFYPESDLAKGLCEFAGCTTLTKPQLEQLKRLGFKIEVTVPGIEGLTD